MDLLGRMLVGTPKAAPPAPPPVTAPAPAPPAPTIKERLFGRPKPLGPLRLTSRSSESLIDLLSVREPVTVRPIDAKDSEDPKDHIFMDTQSIAYSAYEAYINQYPRTGQSPCTENIETQTPFFIATLSFDGINAPGAPGTYAPKDAKALSDFEGMIRSLGEVYTPEQQKEVIKYNKYWINDELAKNASVMTKYAENFRNCTKPFMFLPLTLAQFYFNVKDGVFDFVDSYHANGLLLGKDGRVIRIEPSNNFQKNTSNDIQFNKKLLRFAEEIGVPSPRLVPIHFTCPQRVLNKDISSREHPDLDKNCLFWTFFLYTKITELEFGRDPNEAVAKYSLENSAMTRKELINIIEDFKVKLVSEIIPKGLEILGWYWRSFNLTAENLKYERLPYGSSRKTIKNKRKRKLIRKSKKRFNL